MPPRRILQTSSIFNKTELLSRFHQSDIKEVHAWNLWNFLIRNPQSHWNECPQLPIAAHALIGQEFSTFTSKLIRSSISSDNATTKLLIQLQDGHQIETVIMKYDTTEKGDMMMDDPTGGVRATVCVSSQVGCRMGCAFCATGTMGLKANLTCGEIIEQIVFAQRFSDLRNVVFMGMGEPLDNYDHVKDAVELLASQKCFGLARHRITISTVGVYRKFQNIAQDLPGISLAFSLSAPTQELRRKIVPSSSAYKLETVIESLRHYIQTTKQKVFVEYVLLAGVNDQPEHAHQVGVLLSGMNVVLNLIPFNPSYAAGIDFQPPSKPTVLQFQSIVNEQYHILCTVRQEKGQDIAGACGQLALLSNPNSYSSASLEDVEDLCS